MIVSLVTESSESREPTPASVTSTLALLHLSSWARIHGEIATDICGRLSLAFARKTAISHGISISIKGARGMQKHFTPLLFLSQARLPGKPHGTSASVCWRRRGEHFSTGILR